jgi:RNA polymerase sigma-70 factor (ECF subfamily)
MKPRTAAAPGIPAFDDADVVARLGRGDLGALGELYDRHHRAVRAFLARATSNASDVDDLVQNTFLSASAIAGRYDGRASCRPWLIGIAAKLVQRRRRSLAQILRFVTRFAAERPCVRDPRPQIEARDGLHRVAEILERMDVAKRVVVLMAEVEGLTCQEIADALGIQVGTVWGRLHAARRDLRAALPIEAGS